MVLSGSSMILVGIFLRYSDLFRKFLLGPVYGMPCQTCVLIGANVITFLFITAFLCSICLCPKVCLGWPMLLCLLVCNYCNGIWCTTQALSSSGMVSLGELYMSCLRVLMGWKLLLYLWRGG